MSDGGVLRRIVQRISGTKAFAKVAPPIVTNVDRLVYKVTGGRRILAGGVVPTAVLTSTGAKSGEERVVPLACVPDGDVFYLVGSNFGRERHPAWTHNLIAHPDAKFTFEGETFPVTATLLDDDEKAAVWPKLLDAWPNYDRYQDRSGRNIRVFRLERP